MLDGVDARCRFAALGIRSSLGHLISGWGAAQGKAMPEWHSRCGQLLDTLNSFGKFGGRNIHTACILWPESSEPRVHVSKKSHSSPSIHRSAESFPVHMPHSKSLSTGLISPGG